MASRSKPEPLVTSLSLSWLFMVSTSLFELSFAAYGDHKSQGLPMAWPPEQHNHCGGSAFGPSTDPADFLPVLFSVKIVKGKAQLITGTTVEGLEDLRCSQMLEKLGQ